MRKSDIKETLNYPMFRLLPTGINREVDSKHAAEMRMSVVTNENQRIILVAKLEFLDQEGHIYIIDGQHLLQALIALEQYVVYKFIKIDTKAELIRTIAELNNTLKPWNLMDHIKAWSIVEPDYVHMLKKCRLYGGIKPQGIAMVAMNDPRRRMMSKVIKSGSYRVYNKARFNTVMRFVIDLISLPGFENSNAGYFPLRLISAFLIYYNSVDNYDHELIKDRMITNVDVIRGVFAAENELERVLEEQIFYVTEEDSPEDGR